MSVSTHFTSNLQQHQINTMISLNSWGFFRNVSHAMAFNITRECGLSHKNKSQLMNGKLCDFIHYQVQYLVFIVFIVAYITLKFQLNIQ